MKPNSRTAETIEKIKYHTFKSRKIRIDDIHECTMQAFMDDNEFGSTEEEAEVAISLYNLQVGESFTLNWMTAPQITRIS